MSTKLLSFHTGTIGLHEHRLFIESIDEKKIKIIHSYTLYHEYSHSHKPAYLNYVVQYPKENKILSFLKKALNHVTIKFKE